MGNNNIQLCEDCAEKAGMRLPEGHCASFWEDTCDVCLKVKDVTDIHDYKKIENENLQHSRK
jgi:hypothetical protein